MSCSAPTPPASYRARQSTTVGRLVPVRLAISAFGNPSAASNTIRTRNARPARIELDGSEPPTEIDHPHAVRAAQQPTYLIVPHY
jgi:hypothetical protein